MVRLICNVKYLNIFHSLRFQQRHNIGRMSSTDATEKQIELRRIRNFSIVAHVDHGKSTLADRLLEITGVIKAGGENAQVLDQLQVERERGITVKAVTASLNYTHNGETYLLNLIDTPGHVDFSNEVVRSVTACQGVIMLVDANEGVQAQTVAVHALSKKNNLVIIPTLNKVDLPRADPEKVKSQLQSVFKIDPDTVMSISAKKGWGVKELLQEVIERIPPPTVDESKHFRAHIIDTWHDKYRGVLCLAYIHSGKVQMGQAVKWSSDFKLQTIKYLALLRPSEEPIEEAIAGQVVMVGCGPKGGGAVGDQLLAKELVENKNTSTVPPVKHMVYAGIFPADQSQHMMLSDSIRKLALNDSAVTVSADSSPALGQGWRIGFLGLLHLDVFTQRLLQEYKAEAILTAPSVPYKIKVKGAKALKQYRGEEVLITNPLQLPDVQNIEEWYEPLVVGTIITPVEYIGVVTTLCIDRRGVPLPASAVDDKMTMMQFILPLSEVVIDFHDTLKSVTSGFASFDYYDHGFHPSALVRFILQLLEVVIDFHEPPKSVNSGFASFDYYDLGFHPSALVRFILQLLEVVIDFHEPPKSVNSGFASFDYYDLGFHPSALVRFILQLLEVVIDFHEPPKSVNSGFASFDYYDLGFHPSALVRFILQLLEVVIDFHEPPKCVNSGFASFDYYDHGFHPSALVRFILQLLEVVIDFHEPPKSVNSGFASFDYYDLGFHPSALVRMDILLNGVLVDELSTIVHTSRLEFTARRLTEKLKEMIPRQMVQIAIQAVVSGKVFARETIKAFRKDVTAKLYGGDITRRKKLLKQQAEGKKKMRSVANIKVPRNTFIDVLKR